VTGVQTCALPILAAPLPATAHTVAREIVIVDDASTDGSADAVRYFIETNPHAAIRLRRHSVNQGKGAAIRTALQTARGEFTLIQDADLEYDPCEYSKLLAPLLDDHADVVYGSRFAPAGERRILYFWHSLANYILTTACNVVSDLNLTDMETCYKAFRTSLARSIPLRSNRFGIEPELTIKFAKRQARIYEIPITYRGRTYEEGKKIGLSDAFAAVFVILRYAMSSDIYSDSGPEILDALSDANRFNRWMADTVAPYLGKDVLELGAGMGNLSRLLAPRRRRYIASDIDAEHLARLRTRLQHRPNVSIALCDLAKPDDFNPFHASMDTVVCLNVLEHVPDDMTGLRNIRSALRPDGRAIILVPQSQRLYGTLDEVLGHCRRYSKQELAEKMTAAGFTIEKILDFNRITSPGWYVNGRILKKRTFSRLQLSIFDRLVPLWRRIDHLLPWASTSIIAHGVPSP